MVQRNKSRDERRVALKAKKSAKETALTRPIQRRGRTMLNNPLIPPELDEDVDDDLAFNSDDEELYGQFFHANAQTPKTGSRAKPATLRQGRRNARSESDNDEIDSQFIAVSKAAGGAASSRPQSQGKRVSIDDDVEALGGEEGDGYSSDGDGYMDLSDMLDQSLAQERAKQDARGGDKTSTTVLTEDGRRVGKKRRRGATVTAQDESLYDVNATSTDGASGVSYTAMLGNLVQRAAGSVEEKQAQSRLERALHNRHNLITVDEDETTKARITRREVRQVVERDLKKYQPTLRELSTAKHLELPFRPPDSTPTATSLGAVAAAAEARFGDAATAADGCGTSGSRRLAHGNVAERFASRMSRMLMSAGLAPTSTPGVSDGDASGRADHPTGTEFGDHVVFDDAAPAEGIPRRGGAESSAPGSVGGYVAKLKAMLAAENSRRRRFNKIKSKTYRRILRKEKEHDRERRQKAFELLHPELARKRLAEKLAKARAEERVTQKHKNTSLWVKHVKRFAGRDEETRDALNEQLALHQRLMSKMEQGAGEGLYEQYVADDARSDMSSEEDRVVDALLTRGGDDGGAAAESGKCLSSVLWNSDHGTVTTARSGEGASSDPRTKARAELMEMRFMKVARDREGKLWEEQMRALQEDVRRYHEDGVLPEGTAEMDSSARPTSDAAPAASVTGAAGRGSFTAKSAVDPTSVERIELKTQVGIRATAHGSLVEHEETHHPFTPQTTVAASAFAGDRAKAPDRTGVVVRPRVTALGEESTIKPHQLTSSSVPHSVGECVTAELPSPNEAQVNLNAQQQYLISRAFAQDDVDDDFVRQKESEVEVIMRPEDVNSQLPGWGEWGGEDPGLNTRHHERVAHATTQKQIEKSFLLNSRADAALSHVIINHDGVELVPNRMTLHMIPRPFSNPQEFARSLRQPSGPEWTSALAFKESTQPRVEVRQGQAVTPLDLSLRPKRNKTRRRKFDKTSL